MWTIRTFLALALLAPATANGKVITVDIGGLGDFATIQAAVDAAGDGDTVEIKPGTFAGTGNRDIDVRGKAITIRSVDPNDPAVVDATIIDCGDSPGDPHQGFCLIGRAPTVTLAGLTITGAHSVNGGGVKCLGFVTVRRCHILNCSASRGGAIYCSGLWDDESLLYLSDGDGATVRILDCRIERNAAEMGGGIYASSDSVLVKGCEIDNNRAISNGGAIAGDFTVADLENNTIRGNRAGREGGAIWLHETAATVADSWVVGNWAARRGGALCARNIQDLEPPKIHVRGSTLVGNETDGEAGGLFLQNPENDERPGYYGLINSSILWQNKDRTGSGLTAQIRGPVQTAYYCCIQAFDPHETGWWGSHSLASDPVLVRWPSSGGDGWGDNPDTDDVDESRNDDFGDPHLQPGSPCIQAGDPTAGISLWAIDVDGQPRRMDKIVDIGVDEYTVSGLAILRPRGGEILTGGTTQEIVWQGPNSERRLRLELIANGGKYQQVLDPNAPCSGRLVWQVPEAVQSDDCVVRATPVPLLDTPDVTSTDSFSIHPAGFQTQIASGWRTSSANFQRTGRSQEAGPTVGCLRWRFDRPYRGITITCVPVVGLNGRIHFATEEEQVCTLDADGRLLWACDVHDVVWGSPTVADDGTVYACSSAGRVHEISPDGRLRRSYHVRPTNDSPAILAQGWLGLSSGILHPPTRGLCRFDVPIQSMAFASPAVGLDGLLYVALWDMPGLCAFYPDSCDRKWSFIPESHGQPFAGPVVGDNGLVYQTFLDDTYLYAIDAKTGTLTWKTDLADPHVVSLDRNLTGRQSWSEPVLGPDGTIYASLDDPFIRAIDPATGRIKWVTHLGSGKGFMMAVDKQGYIYAASEDHCLYVLDAEGRWVSVFEAETALGCPVIAGKGLLLVVSMYGNVLYAIEADPVCTSPVLGPPHP